MRAIVVHGGAGAKPRDDAAPKRSCEEAVALGWAILTGGGSALDAVVRAVVHLENEPSLNAGRGACLDETGGVELDAAVMDGHGRRAGAVALVRRLPNPVLAARAVMDEGRHVFMAGEPAEAFAESHGLGLVDPTTLVTPERRAAWERRAGDVAQSGDAAGTVGAVALDAAGHVAAATSTGGISGKRPGRIGDSPIIGAGTLADDRAGAVSATGDGEAIIRATVASTIVTLLRDGVDPGRAAAEALRELDFVGGSGGVIVVDRFGRVAAAHSAPHMTWASRRGDGP
ncbi:MAG TPA: isoaspartyl peptidase/L-asparaginase [Candidatus Binatia bacterium]